MNPEPFELTYQAIMLQRHRDHELYELVEWLKSKLADVGRDRPVSPDDDDLIEVYNQTKQDALTRFQRLWDDLKSDHDEGQPPRVMPDWRPEQHT